MCRWIEGREGLVEEDNVGLDGEGPGQADTARLPAGECPDGTVFQMGHAEYLQVVDHGFFDLFFACMTEMQSRCNILKDSRVKEKGLLEYHRDRPAVRGDRYIGADPFAAIDYLAVPQFLEHGKSLKEGCLPRAVGPDDGENFVFPYQETGDIKNHNAAVFYADIAGLQDVACFSGHLLLKTPPPLLYVGKNIIEYSRPWQGV